ncbi:hypothetical protein RCO28_01125 [Streptomyces sp. LHD-70]|uniref:hypothetical protein n=1 Tax=Streptomyces sp. LHD-70 TaxID=3072140 RepID=UPI00280FE7C4|nr:hypothetical protein [Streptomyces sp. LHD-70]MDQ8701093.1 hypothetical protein [Streptomyces sp. LHD-70]
MISRSRLLPGAAVAVAAAVLGLTGCGAPGGLARGEAAPSVAVQPSPEAVWPSWAGRSPKSPAADTTEHEPPPRPLDGVRVPAGGLGQMSVRDILAADPRVKQYADRELIHGPGRAGVRPPSLSDLTGDGRPELLVAIDTESGSTVVTAYRDLRGEVAPILLARGKRVAVERLGTDLVLRQPCADGGEQAIRYRWDGERMSTASDTKTYAKTPPRSHAKILPPPSPSPTTPASPSPTPRPSDTAR